MSLQLLLGGSLPSSQDAGVTVKGIKKRRAAAAAAAAVQVVGSCGEEVGWYGSSRTGKVSTVGIKQGSGR
jgi:hypothetical protein